MNYRFKCQIVDEDTDEVIISGSTYVSKVSLDGSCESVELELYSMLRAFRNEHENN